MALCKKCQKREQHTFPNGRTVAMCAVCGLELLYALFDEPEESGPTPVAADTCPACAGTKYIFDGATRHPCFLCPPETGKRR